MRRYGRVYVAPSRIHGEGTFAAERIRAGERIWAVDDSNVVPEGMSHEEAERLYNHHCDDLAGGKKVILREPDGWINHSCDPNVSGRPSMESAMRSPCGTSPPTRRSRTTIG